MKISAPPEIARLSEFIAEKMGLHFPPERWADLQRGLAGAAVEFGLADAAACADWLLSASRTKAEINLLASHLTVGETYFFRDRRTFDALGESVLPELIRSRRGREQRLRLWSAACCTGEEPYSLAILLQQILPDLADWNVTILATDINVRFLHKACAGIYGEWSFRETPAWFKKRYFQRLPDGRHAISPEIKKRVTFAHLNLIEDGFPSLATDTNAMDVIFCRNVLMYFAMPQIRKVVGNLRRALLDDGWLAVSPSEGSQTLLPQFNPVNFPGVTLFQKSGGKVPAAPLAAKELQGEPGPFVAPAQEALSPGTPPAALPRDGLVAMPRSPYAAAKILYEQGRYAEVADALVAASTAGAFREPETYSLLARALANQGRLAEALRWCDRWVRTDKLDAAGHYLRAVIFQELGDPEEARRSLQRALYLDPKLILGHFALGNLARARDRDGEAERHFANALLLLRGCAEGEILPESDGLTAGRLAEIITSLFAKKATP